METTKRNPSFISEQETDTSNDNCNEIFSNSDAFEKIKPENTAENRTCSFFYNNGFCKFGTKCRYKHMKRVSENNEHFIRNKKSSVPRNVHKNKKLEDENILRDSNNLPQTQQICKYLMLGSCKKGDNCEYLHSFDVINSEMNSLTISSQSQNIPKKIFSPSDKLKKRPLCYYFKKGYCYKGDNCKYYHPQKNHSKGPDNFHAENDSNNFLRDRDLKPMNKNSSMNRNSSNFRRTFNVYHASSLTPDTIFELRATEINQMKKRFPSFEIISENQTYSVLFQPSDPDWAFDVKKLKLEIEFPEQYPTEKCRISVIHSAENIPLLLIKHLNKAINQWIDKKFEENHAVNKVELIFRPFLRWFDKNIEDLFIAGLRKVKQDLLAKEAGIEFVPAETLFPANGKTDAEKESLSDSLQFEEQTPITEIKNSPSESIESNKPSHYNSNDGMKIVFTNLELIEGAAAFICTKISVTLQCSRCKTFFNMKSVPKKSNSHVCTKCSKTVGFTFESSTVHQFSSVLGSLHLLDCVAVDINLVECYFLIDCLNCSKQVPTEGIHYGQKYKMWCTYCSEKIVMSIGAVKFQALKLSVPVSKYPIAKKVEKRSKDPVIKEGEPLPNFGACKHYKKSYRWLRFPCCGRLYPCDECHNEKETDHEMKYSSRMICGFCAKEQPYSREKPCMSCAQSMTKKSGSHWEGGKGCRNKILMSREDKQKYAGTCKTVSKKAQTTKTKKKH